MPYVTHDDVAHSDGRSFSRGSVVDDATGAALIEDHPDKLSRVSHDDDLCVAIDGGCDHESHKPAVADAPAPIPFRSNPLRVVSDADTKE